MFSSASLRIKRHRLDTTSTSMTIIKDNYGEISFIKVNKNAHDVGEETCFSVTDLGLNEVTEA